MQITLTRPDDFHLHLRDGAVLATTVPATARTFARAIVMPNLTPPVTTAFQASVYKKQILENCPEGSSFQPLMTLYLTDRTSPDIVREAKSQRDVFAFKLYPAGATTNSDAGVTSLENIYPVLETMIDCGLPLLIHGEVTDQNIDIFDREKVFIERHLQPLAERFPELKIVMEHITTADAASFVCEAGANIAATITPQHLLYNRNHMLVGGIKPHYYCLPILKRNIHQEALIKAATSGNPKFFLGTDSAPIPEKPKRVPVAALAAIQLLERLSSMPKPSKTPVHWISWKAFPVIMALTSTACPVTLKSLLLRKKSPRFQIHCPWETAKSFP